MIRLTLLLVAVLAVVLLVWGDPAGRTEPLNVPRQSLPAPAAEAPAADTAPPAEAPAIVPAATPAAPAAQRLPGPRLQPSPEHAGAAAPQAGATPAPADGPLLYVTGSRVNMRGGPSTGDAVIAALTQGTAVSPVGPADGEWVQVRDPNGRTGFVAGRFLSAEAP